MWSVKKHGPVSVGMTFEMPSEQLEGRTTATVTWWYLCQCGLMHAKQSTCEFGSEEGLEEMASGLIAAVSVVCGRTAIAEPSPVSASGLSTSLMRTSQRVKGE